MAFHVYLLLSAVVFILHCMWESAHIRLYRNYDALRGVLPVPVWAALGDVLYTLLVVGLIALVKGTMFWFEMATPKDYIACAILGFLTALFVEYKAFAFKRWEYTNRMPVVPFLGVGISSLIQKTLLFPLSIWITTVLVRLIDISY